MNQVEKSIQNLAREINPKIIFVAVSAGVDSTLLLELMATYFNVVALHVNYKLRGKDSDQDQAFLEEYCSRKSIPILVEIHDLKTELSKRSSNLQNRAREIRYEFFKKNLDKNEGSCLFLGHHSDDQIETFFIQYFRNSGIAGLSGMREREGLIFRPFLSFSKQELIQCANDLKLEWREDSSNAKNDYLRNRLRNEMIPFLDDQIPTLNSSILSLMETLQENQIQLEQETSNFIQVTKVKSDVPISQFSGWGDERWIELLRQLSLSTGFLKEFKKLLQSVKGAKLEFPKNELIQSIIRENDSLYFKFLENEEGTKPIITSSIVSDLPKVFSKQEIYLDDTRIDGELHIRKWSRGDRIYPIGLNGSKLISDVLTNAKVPHVERYNQWLLCDRTKIISCIGICIDRRALATKETLKIRRVQIE